MHAPRAAPSVPSHERDARRAAASSRRTLVYPPTYACARPIDGRLRERLRCELLLGAVRRDLLCLVIRSGSAHWPVPFGPSANERRDRRPDDEQIYRARRTRAACRTGTGRVCGPARPHGGPAIMCGGAARAAGGVTCHMSHHWMRHAAHDFTPTIEQGRAGRIRKPRGPAQRRRAGSRPMSS